eukprot:scaffold175_cov66-Cyclotella_meneghiniana.AAC.1
MCDKDKAERGHHDQHRLTEEVDTSSEEGRHDHDLQQQDVEAAATASSRQEEIKIDSDPL